MSSKGRPPRGVGLNGHLRGRSVRLGAKVVLARVIVLVLVVFLE